MIASFSESVTSRLSPVFQTSHVGPILENFPSVPAFLSLISERAQTGAAHYLGPVALSAAALAT